MVIRRSPSMPLAIVALAATLGVLTAGCGSGEQSSISTAGIRVGSDVQLPFVLDGDRLGISSLDGNAPSDITGPGDFAGLQLDPQGRLLFVKRSGQATGFYKMEDAQPQLVIPFERESPWTPQAAWSPDGSKGAWLETSDGDTQLFVQEVGGKARSRDLGVCEGCYNLTWSPAADKVAVSADYPKVVSYIVDLNSSAAPLELDLGSVRAWSSRDDLLIWQPSTEKPGGRGLLLAKPDGSDERALGDLVVPLEGAFRTPGLSPDGRWVAWGHDMTAGDTELAVGIAATDGSERTDTTCSTCGTSIGLDPAWSPDGQQIAWSQDGHILAADVGVWQGHVIADGEQPVWSPDGSKIAFLKIVSPSQSPMMTIMVKAGDGSGSEVKVAELQYYIGADGFVAWTADSKGLVVPMQAAESSNMASFDPATGEVQEVPLADNETVYAVDPEGSRFLINAGGSIGSMDGSRRQLDAPDRGSCYEWPKDGLKALCVGLGLKTMDLDTGEVETLLEGDFADAAWSPDGSRIAFVRNLKLGVLDVATGATTTIAPELNAALYANTTRWDEIVWSPDGSRIAFLAFGASNDTSVYIVNADGSGLSGPLIGLQGSGFLAFSPDGKWLAGTSAGGKIIDADTGEQKVSYGDYGYRAPVWLDSQTLLISAYRSIEAVGVDGSVREIVGGTMDCDAGLISWAEGKIYFVESCVRPGV